jgi:DNA-binding transcriptional ArsR family regulator
MAIVSNPGLADVSRLRILEELRGQGGLDSRELGRLVGLHPNTVRSHVDQLIEAGLVRAVSALASGRGRPRVLYEAIVDAPVHKSGYRVGFRKYVRQQLAFRNSRSVARPASRVF